MEAANESAVCGDGARFVRIMGSAKAISLDGFGTSTRTTTNTVMKASNQRKRP
jgi:hypothetical protein